MGTGGNVSGSGGLDGGGAFGKEGFNAGDLAAQEVETSRIFQLADLLLNAQVEHFLAQFAAACAQFLNGKLAVATVCSFSGRAGNGFCRGACGPAQRKRLRWRR